MWQLEGEGKSIFQEVPVWHMDRPMDTNLVLNLLMLLFANFSYITHTQNKILMCQKLLVTIN